MVRTQRRPRPAAGRASLGRHRPAGAYRCVLAGVATRDVDLARARPLVARGRRGDGVRRPPALARPSAAHPVARRLDRPAAGPRRRLAARGRACRVATQRSGWSHDRHRFPARPRVRHLPDRRRPRGKPPRLRRHAITGAAGGASPTTMTSAIAGPAPGGRARGRLRRHRRLVRPVRVRGPDPRGAAPVRRRPRRDEGGLPRSGRACGPTAIRPTCVSAPDVAAPPRRRDHRPLPAAPHRPGLPARGPARCFADLVRGQGAPRGPVRDRLADLEAAQAILPIATVQNLYNVANRQARRCSTSAPRRASASSPGSRWPRERWRRRTVRWRPWLRAPDTRRLSCRWPGCCAAPR